MMTKFLLAFMVCSGWLVASAVITVAQKASTPPKVASEIRTADLYESKEGGFKVNFPARPTLNVIEKPSSFGKTSITVYSLTTSMASYSVTFLDFPTVMNDKFDLNIRFDAMRDAQAKQLSARVMSDSEFYFGSYYGRSVVFETLTSTHSLRIFVVRPRMFLVGVQTKGKMSTQTEKLRSCNQSRVEKFFNSFSITKVSEAKSTAVELPSDFGVSLYNGVFYSEFFSARLRAPEGWFGFSRESSDAFMELGKDSIKYREPELVDHLTPENARALGVFSNHDPEKEVATSFLMIFAERVPYPTFVPSAVAKTYSTRFLDQDEKVVQPISSVKYGGADFAWVEVFSSKSKLYQRLYVANRRGISFEILLMYKDEADLRTLLKSMDSLEFLATPSK